MANILVNYRPFIMAQEISVWEMGKCIESFQATIDEIPDTVRGLCNKYSGAQVALYGNKDYLSKFKAELGSKFINDDIEIVILSK